MFGDGDGRLILVIEIGFDPDNELLLGLGFDVEEFGCGFHVVVWVRV